MIWTWVGIDFGPDWGNSFGPGLRIPFGPTLGKGFGPGWGMLPDLYIKSTTDPRIVFPGYIYGDDTVHLMKHAFAYIQPSDIEGLSPVILMVMGLGTPFLCSDIPENVYLVQNPDNLFMRGDVENLRLLMEHLLGDYEKYLWIAQTLQKRILKDYSWESVARQHREVFESV